MFCNNCGEKLAEDVKFCPNCGQKADYSSRLNSSSRNDLKSSSGDRWNSNNNQKNISTNLRENAINSDSIFNKWKGWSTGEKLLSIIVCCCIGISLLGAIGSLMTPDQNTANYEDYNSYNGTTVDDISEDDNSTEEASGENETTDSDSNDSSSDSSKASLTDDSSSSSDSSDSYSSSSGSSSYNDDSEPVTGGSYVASKNSNKFHRASCGHASRIKEYNRRYYSSRDEAISAGKVPCKFCDP
ncbi:Metal binding domain of Ada [Methanobrevibacter olleyae]|uniref:Metal binding domain of Ada n=1 Tax=Methanobrevibacter olleyae TaxID=294671 RepID=A0A1I4KS74_METOL|nr:zinc ribbon domain-containing protein [Methanobrevibacter olleyae]SFL81605.1 Metal binding domain of Ada [Methanobrevibacter olleyae]